MANAGVGAVETFAVQALSGTGDPAYVETFRYRLGNALHTETRLAAAAALGRLGSDDGFDFALRSLTFALATSAPAAALVAFADAFPFDFFAVVFAQLKWRSSAVSMS